MTTQPCACCGAGGTTEDLHGGRSPLCRNCWGPHAEMRAERDATRQHADQDRRLLALLDAARAWDAALTALESWDWFEELDALSDARDAAEDILRAALADCADIAPVVGKEHR